MTSQDDISSEEADILLFLADELDPQQRNVFEARLKANPSLRTRLAELRAVDERLCSVSVPNASTAFASDRVLKSSLRLVREQVILRNQSAAAPRVFRIPPYAIAAGIAIVFTLGFIGWLYTTPPVVVSPPAVANNNRQGFGPGFAGNVGGPAPFLSGFVPVGVDQYGDASREIDQEIDALSMLADFEEGPESN